MRTWPPGVSWYSSDSAQLMASGTQRGTVTAMAPPGRRTRASSRMAAVSSGMCSSTSDAITRSKVPSGKGSDSASPCTAVAGMVRRDLPRLDHGGEGAAHLCHLLGAGVEGHHRGAAAGGLEGMASEAAAEVEHEVAGTDAESVVVDGQHQAAPRASGVSETVGRGRRGAREGLALDDGLVAGGGPGRGDLPGEAAHDPLAPGRAEARPQVGVVEQAGDGAGQRARVVGRHEQPGLPVGADDFGQGAARRGDDGDAAGHRLDGRQREPLVERGHDRHLAPRRRGGPARRR